MADQRLRRRLRSAPGRRCGSDALLADQNYDANNNQLVWVRSEAKVGEHTPRARRARARRADPRAVVEVRAHDRAHELRGLQHARHRAHRRPAGRRRDVAAAGRTRSSPPTRRSPRPPRPRAASPACAAAPSTAASPARSAAWARWRRSTRSSPAASSCRRRPRPRRARRRSSSSSSRRSTPAPTSRRPPAARRPRRPAGVPDPGGRERLDRRVTSRRSARPGTPAPGRRPRRPVLRARRLRGKALQGARHRQRPRRAARQQHARPAARSRGLVYALNQQRKIARRRGDADARGHPHRPGRARPRRRRGRRQERAGRHLPADDAVRPPRPALPRRRAAQHDARLPERLQPGDPGGRQPS